MRAHVDGTKLTRLDEMIWIGNIARELPGLARQIERGQARRINIDQHQFGDPLRCELTGNSCADARSGASNQRSASGECHAAST